MTPAPVPTEKPMVPPPMKSTMGLATEKTALRTKPQPDLPEQAAPAAQKQQGAAR
jgi:hypothetical protein